MTFHPTLGIRLSKFRLSHDDEEQTQQLATYQIYRKYFRENIAVPNITLSDAKIGVVLVYTWMHAAKLNPACWKHFALAKKMLRRDRAGRLTAHEMETLKSFVGGSLTATSKFLHLVNPGRYAMWDANIAKTAYGYSWQQTNCTDSYIGYLDDLRVLELDGELQRQVQDAIGCPSDLRQKEFALSQLGHSKSVTSSNASQRDITDFPFETTKFTFDLTDRHDDDQ